MARPLVTFPPEGWAEYQRHRSEIAGILDPRCYTVAWLDGEILNRRAMACGNDSAVIVVTVKHYPAGASELHGLVSAGELNGILSLIDAATAAAESNGMTFATIASRPEWARVLRDRGFVVHQTVIRKELSYGPQ